HEEVLAVDAVKRRLTRQSDQAPRDAGKLERAGFSSVNSVTGETIANVRSDAGRAVGAIQRRLQDLELLVTEDRSWQARLIPLLVVLSVVFFGVLKVFVGLSRDRPVIFLVIFCIISVVVAFVGFGRAVHRSRRGDRVLERLRKRNAALEYSRSWRADDLAGDDLALAVGLFGMGVLA